MKRILYFISAVILVLSFLGCGGNGQKASNKDSAAIVKTNPAPIEDTPKSRGKAFLDSAVLKKLKSDEKLFYAFAKRFDPLEMQYFNNYRSQFASMFNLGSSNSPIQHGSTLHFSIYEMFQGFQHDLNLQDGTFTDPSTSITYEKRVRIYPALDVTKNFYLVLMAELKDITTQPTPPSITDISVYYVLKQESPFGTLDVHLQRVAPTQMATVNSDIQNFQTAFTAIINQNPALTFRNEKSFSYSIIKYNLLMGSSLAYWDIPGATTDPNSNLFIKIDLGIDKDDLTDVRFRLMLKLCRMKANGLQEITGKTIFDNMDPCPRECPQ